MARELSCPNCGGQHTLVNPGITMMVCSYCQTVVYWDDETALKQGIQSILPEADTRLFMHATGKMMGKGFEVVGHLRYDHGAGTWDEWYLQMDDGSVAWLSEDERELSLEQFMRPDPNLPAPDQLQVGQPVTMEGAAYSIREIGRATCVGGEGQLPFTVLPGEQYPYADLASHDGSRFATLEYDEGQSPRCFTGQVLDHQQLSIDEEKPPTTAGAHEGKHIKCPNCAAPLEVSADREVQTLVCEYCGAQNDLTQAQAKVMAINPKDFEHGLYLEIGQAGTFAGKRYEICGRMVHEDEEGYQEREYLLHNPDEGYLWLTEENGHYVLNRPTQMAPSYAPFGGVAKQSITIGPTTFRFYEAGISRVIYVDGALPWRARTGDRARWADLIDPPKMFGIEQAGQEMECFLGRYMTPEEIWTAFDMQERPPRAYGIHPAQPFVRGPVAKLLMILGGIFALVNLGLLLWSFTTTGKVVMEETFHASSYLQETQSKPFVVGNSKIMAMEIHAPLNNSWLALDVALYDEKKQAVVEEVDSEISYYHGVEGGESWTEGERKKSTYCKAPPAGTYRLILKGSAGSGISGPSLNEPLTIRLYEGGILSRYFLVAFILTFLFPFFEIARKHLFEQRRWAPVVEDDDDDDDWDD